MKWKKRGLEAIDDHPPDVVLIEPHARMTKPKLARHRRVGDEPVVGVDRHA
jgi:hypothetical protein